ncbi:MAG TPA: hypothetical protein VIV64_02505 [Gammaproteobacteria bacterium]|jgi:hypothetical protein
MKALLTILSVFLVACSGPGGESTAGQDATVFDPLTGTMDRAAGVEDTLRESDAARRREIDAAQGL